MQQNLLSSWSEIKPHLNLSRISFGRSNWRIWRLKADGVSRQIIFGIERWHSVTATLTVAILTVRFGTSQSISFILTELVQIVSCISPLRLPLFHRNMGGSAYYSYFSAEFLQNTKIFKNITSEWCDSHWGLWAFRLFWTFQSLGSIFLYSERKSNFYFLSPTFL